MVPLQTHGCYNAAGCSARFIPAVVPLQTHGCYNPAVMRGHGVLAVVPLQTHGCYNTHDLVLTARGPWFPYRLTGAIIKHGLTDH